jgi:hypothetical protein
VSHEGGCACGAVRYVVDGPLRDVLVCHCSDCVEAAGHAWAATAAHRRDLALREGEGLRWRRAPSSAHDASRGRCYRCGTLVFWDAPDRDTVSIGVDTLDEPPALVVGGHIWVAHDPGWEPDEEEAELEIPSYPRGAPKGVKGPALRWID